MLLSLIEKMLKGDRASLSRLMTHFENRSSGFVEAMAQIEPRLGHAQKIGITGPPGAGKSTLVDQLIGSYRKLGKTVGVVAVDPSSPFSGGALLGDRIRMMAHAEDREVFIRSLGSRGAHGGLSRATQDVVRLFDAFGKDIILIETVGVGQTELDVLEISDTTVVVLTPESGDTIQTLKAGLLEAADVFVINKADREGAMKIEQELHSMLHMNEKHEEDGWQIPIFKTQANEGVGIGQLVEGIYKHFKNFSHHPQKLKKQQLLREQEWNQLLQEELYRQLNLIFQKNSNLEKWKKEIIEGKVPLYQAVQELREKIEINLR